VVDSRCPIGSRHGEVLRRRCVDFAAAEIISAKSPLRTAALLK
jgi:hypothetical protein